MDQKLSINQEAAAAAADIIWDSLGPIPPEGWTIIMIDPSEGKFADMEVGEEAFSPDGESLGFTWGEAGSLLRREQDRKPRKPIF